DDRRLRDAGRQIHVRGQPHAIPHRYPEVAHDADFTHERVLHTPCRHYRPRTQRSPPLAYATRSYRAPVWPVPKEESVLPRIVGSYVVGKHAPRVFHENGVEVRLADTCGA